MPYQSDQPSPWQRFKDTFIQSAVHSPLGGGGLARAYFKHQGWTDDQINKAIGNMDADFDKKYSKAPVFQHVRDGHPLDYASPDNIGRGAVSLMAHVLGGVDPTYAVAPGKTAIERVLGQAAVQGGSSIVRQKVKVNTGQQKKIHPDEVLEDMAAGALFQGGGEAAGKLVRKGAEVVGKLARKADKIHPDEILAPDGLPGNGSVRPMDPHEISRIMDDPEAVGGTPRDRRQNNRDIREAPADVLTDEHIDEYGPAEGRQHKSFNEIPTDATDGTKFLNYTSHDGETIPIKMGIEPDGTAEIAIDQFSTKANRLGPKEIRSAMYDLMDMYPEIKRFGGYRRSGAGKGRVQEIEPARPDILQRDYGTGASGYVPSDGGLPPEIIENAHQFSPEHLADMKVRARQGEPIEYDTEIRRADAEEDATNGRYKELTPAERYGMDASAEKPVVDNTGYEAHTPYAEPPEPMNDTSRLDALNKFVPNLLGDERGSIPGSGGDEPPKITDISDRFVDPEVRDFHKNLMSEIKTKADAVRVAGKVLHESGELPYKVGDEFTTPKSREQGQEPWRVVGHYVDPKDPARYGYRVERGIPDVDRESSLMLVSDPAADTRIKSRGSDFDRRGDVSQWENLSGSNEHPFVDASADKPAVKNSALEFVKGLFNDERGSLGPGEGEESVVGRLIRALKEAEPVRTSQEKLYSKERGARISEAAQVGKFTSGEEGFHAELSKLGGEMPKATFESVRNKFTQPEIDSLFDVVKDAPRLTFFEKVNARTALSKLLGAEGATVPTKSELKLLHEVFPEELTDALLRNPFKTKLGEHIANALNVPRSLMSSVDFSAPGRQGMFLIGSKAYWTSFVDMFKAFGSQKAYDAIAENITSRPTYRLMKQAGLATTNTGKKLSEREEAFMSKWAEAIPLAGRLVKASDRAYSGYLNKLRADTFDSLIKDMRNAGVDFKENPKALKDVARFVNAATGRGDLGKFNQAAPLLAGFFFSPRLMASRLTLLNPATYIDPRISSVVRKQALKSLLSFAGIAMTTLGLAHASGLEVETDPRSSDFAKIKVGNTRYDVTGGFQPYIRTAAQLITGQKKSTTTGAVSDLGKAYGSDTRLDVAEKFFENKASPLASFAMDLLRGKDPVGNELTPESMIAERFIPLIVQDMNDIYKDQGPKGVAEAIVPATFGVGVQTYTPREKKSKKSEFGADFKSGNEFKSSKEFSKEF